MNDWKPICRVEDIPQLGARNVRRDAGADVAIFRTADDKVFALLDRCPHKGGPLSQGIVFGHSVACPLHNWTIGLEDGRAGKAKLSDQEMGAALVALQQKVAEQRAREQAVASEKSLADGKAYLAANAKKPGVTTTASGLQYQILTPGSGKTPVVGDTVTVHYKGTLVDGTEFDSSYKRGQAAQFPLSGVIPCWTEGVQRMKVGGKAVLTCPPDIAYGERGAGAVIPPNATLQFEVELVSITGR